MNRTFLIAAVAGVAAIGGAALWGVGNDASKSVGGFDAASAQEAGAAAPVDVEAFKAAGYAVGDIALGDPNAPVTIIEYARLTCPACGAFHTETLPKLKEKYIDAGKVKLIVREIYVDARGLTAVAISRCNGPDGYHGFLDVFFQRQSDWMNVQNMEELMAKVKPIGRLGGLSADRIDACVGDEAFLQHLIDTSNAQADADKVQRTPTLIINGTEYEGAYYDFDALSAAIDAALP